MAVRNGRRIWVGVALVLAAGLVPACSSPAAKAPAVSEGSATTSAGKTTPAQAGGQGVYEVTGTGRAITIDIDPPGSDGKQHFSDVPLPWRRPFTASADTDIFQVVVVGAENAGCRILIDDKVVAQQPAGSAHCVYQR